MVRQPRAEQSLAAVLSRSPRHSPEWQSSTSTCSYDFRRRSPIALVAAELEGDWLTDGRVLQHVGRLYLVTLDRCRDRSASTRAFFFRRREDESVLADATGA